MEGGRGSFEGAEAASARLDDEAWTKPGTVLGDRFVVERRLGSGGMGYVVLAWNRELGQHVAIKLLLPARAMSEDAQSRLVREARAAARIKSAHVVRIFDVVSRGPGAPYLVMEYLNGETLRQLLSRTERLPVDRAVDIVIQACESVAEAHRNGTIHRDLKPSNLFLTAIPGRPCFVKVFDFGIAKTRESGDSTLTQSQALLASPAYASPEQLRASKAVDERSDVWSLGVILYESVTGRVPFNGQTLAELSSEILRDSPTAPRAHRSDLSPELEGVILRCLAKEPEDRFESVESLVMALEAFAPVAAKECLAYIRDLGVSRSAPPPDFDESSLGPAHHRSTLTHASVATPAERASAKRTNRLVFASLMGAALLGLVIAILRGRAEPVNGSSQAESAAPAVLTAKPTALPVPPASERVESGAERLERGSASLVPASAPSGAAPKVRSEPARKRTKPLPADASAEPKRTEPSPLETLPLSELIDGRK